jgi:hypothetical protein
LEAGSGGDVSGLAECTVEGWFKTADVTDQVTIIQGPFAGGNIRPYTLKLSGSTFVLEIRNDANTLYSLASSTLTNDTWYHVVGTITTGSVRLYINGTQVASTAFTTPLPTPLDSSGANIQIGNSGSSADMYYDELAIYRFGLTAARISAHYTAGTARGFATEQNPGDRINAVLDSITSRANRAIRTGVRNMTGAYMRGQSPLEEMRAAETAENVDSVLFIAKDGTVTFLDDGYRSVSPWNTVQITFDDDGTDLGYFDIDVDYSDRFLANDVSASRSGGNLVTNSDTTSIAAYGKRTLALNEMPITADADVTTAVASVLAKYKDPMFRVQSLTLMAVNSDLIDQVFRLLDIGSRIRVFRTPPGGGARIDQTLFVQNIAVDAEPSPPWRITLGVSPL